MIVKLAMMHRLLLLVVVTMRVVMVMRGVRRVMTMSGLLQGLKIDDEDAHSRLQYAPDLADGSSEDIGREVMHDQAADDDIHGGIRDG